MCICSFSPSHLPRLTDPLFRLDLPQDPLFSNKPNLLKSLHHSIYLRHSRPCHTIHLHNHTVLSLWKRFISPQRFALGVRYRLLIPTPCRESLPRHNQSLLPGCSSRLICVADSGEDFETILVVAIFLANPYARLLLHPYGCPTGGALRTLYHRTPSLS